MNKGKFIEQLMEKTNYPQDKCIIINSILENHFIFGKNNKEKYINDFINELDLDEQDAENLYEICMNIIENNIKNKLKHPFKSND